MAAKGKFGKDTVFSAPVASGSAEDGMWMDIQRRNLVAQEYLTYVGEAKEYVPLSFFKYKS
jgi:hypothetical protein